MQRLLGLGGPEESMNVHSPAWVRSLERAERASGASTPPRNPQGSLCPLPGAGVTRPLPELTSGRAGEHAPCRNVSRAMVP